MRKSHYYVHAPADPHFGQPPPVGGATLDVLHASKHTFTLAFASGTMLHAAPLELRQPQFPLSSMMA